MERGYDLFCEFVKITIWTDELKATMTQDTEKLDQSRF